MVFPDGSHPICDECRHPAQVFIPIIFRGVDEATGQHANAIQLRCVNCMPDFVHIQLQSVRGVFLGGVPL